MLKKIRQRSQDMQKLSSVMTEALKIASEDGFQAAGAQHLLLAAIAMEDDDSGRQAFAAGGADPDQLSDAIERAIGAGVPSIELPEAASAAGGSQMKVDAAFDEAIKATHAVHNAHGDVRPLRAAHFVAGVASAEHGVAVRALAEMGLDRAALIEAATEAAR